MVSSQATALDEKIGIVQDESRAFDTIREWFPIRLLQCSLPRRRDRVMPLGDTARCLGITLVVMCGVGVLIAGGGWRPETSLLPCMREPPSPRWRSQCWHWEIVIRGDSFRHLCVGCLDSLRCRAWLWAQGKERTGFDAWTVLASGS